MQREGSSSASTKNRNDTQRPASHFSNVTSAAPAKRITFFKSGDTQFSGVRMAIHKRSFKCFDALLDDLSQKVPLPFGVRTITTPRGTHSIQRLEQLEDGGCYLCSDRRYVRPIDVEAAGRKPAVWHHSHPHNTRKKPFRPEEPPTGHSNQHYHRHPKRIILVKNNDPTIRRSIILSRRTARSLRVFLEEISELMQCHVRKLYTLEGRKIDSIQSLMQCPSVLVCVGREPFKPLLLENLRKNSPEEKLPGMATRSRSSICSEGHESRKNVNFGLETKKSIIHPRSDSSNRSARFSLSSEKSYPNGLCMTPGQSGCVSTCPYTKDVILNDDVEKRVLVNKDGSLSVEMKVRFRLVNDETLQWSTEIKKSATTLNESSSIKEGGAHYLQGKAECSDPESNSACEAEEACAPKLHQKQVEDSHCQNCCNHCQEYDIWKNPMHKDNRDNGKKSSSCSGSSHKIKKASVDSVRTISRSSEEYTEHVVEKASCFQQTVEGGDTLVEYCSINRCCSRSEILGTAAKLRSIRSNEDTHETSIINMCHHNGDSKPCSVFENRFNDPGIFEVTMVGEDRPISAVSNSSKVLESLKEDQDDDYDDLPPSASRASEWSHNDKFEQDNHFTCEHCYGCQVSPNFHLSPKPPSKASSCSAHSSKHKKYRSMYPAPESARSSVPKVPSRPISCQCRATTPGSVASGIQGLDEHNTIVSNKSRTRTHSPGADIHCAQVVQEEGKESRDRARSAMSANASVSGKSKNSSVCPYCGGCERSFTAASRLSGIIQDTPSQDVHIDAEVRSVGGRSSEVYAKSERSNKCSHRVSPGSNGPENGAYVQNNLAEEDTKGRTESALSGLSNHSATSKFSNKSNRTVCGRSSAVESTISENARVDNIEERTKSAMSMKSNASAKSKINSTLLEVSPTSGQDSQKAEEVKPDEKTVSPVSGKSNRPSRSRSSKRSCSSNSERTPIPECNLNGPGKTLQDNMSEREDSPVSAASVCHEQEPEVISEVRADSARSAKSNSSSKHTTSVLGQSRRSVKTLNESVEKDTVVPPASEAKLDPEFTTQERAESVISNTSKRSKKSNASSRNLPLVQKNTKSTNLNEAVNVSGQVSDVGSEERVPSAMSAKTHCSERSHKSYKSDRNIPDAASPSQPNATSPVTKKRQESTNSERPTSANSDNSKTSGKSGVCSEGVTNSILKPTGKEDRKHSAKNSLTVSSPLPIKAKRIKTPSSSPVMTGNNDRAPSGISVNSRASSKSEKFNKCNCFSNSNLGEANYKNPIVNIASYHSEKKKSSKSHTPSPCSGADEVGPLSPTSTASVSLGLGEEEKSEDFNERSISSLSQNLEEGKCSLERSTPELTVCDHAAHNHEAKEGANSMRSAVSKNSECSSTSQQCRKNSQSVTSPATARKLESVISTKSKPASVTESQLNYSNIRGTSALSSCSKSTCKASQCSENNVTIKRQKDESQVVVKNNTNNESQIDRASNISGSSSKCSQNKTSGKATPTESDKLENQGLVKTVKISFSNIKIRGTNKTSQCNSETSSVKSHKSDNRTDRNEEQSLRPASDVKFDVPQDPSDEMPKRNVMPVIHLDSSSDSILCHTLSAADLLRDKVGNVRPLSRGSGSNTLGKNCDLGDGVDTDSKCKKSRVPKQRKISTSSQNKCEDRGLELMPSTLPNSSPAEIINDWLKNIPVDGHMYEMEDEFNETHDEGSQTVNDEDMETIQKEMGEISENIMEIKESQEEERAVSECSVKEDNNDTQECKEITAVNAANSEYRPPPNLTQREGLPEHRYSSVQVMKVLLSRKLDRCNSLPEVSPVYGRKLSTSAKGLLDCLANLQLIDSDPKNGKDHKYNEIINILQSLWIYDPPDSEQDKLKIKDHCSGEDEFNPRSSSGVDLSSGSIGSGKGSINGGVEKPETAGRIPPAIEQEALQTEEDTVKEGERDTSSALPESTDISHAPDIADRVQFDPEDGKPEEEVQIAEECHAKEEVPQSNENLKETNNDKFSNESSGNDSKSLKSPAGKETYPSAKSNTVQRGVLNRKVSQDPDPVWVLSLLKKLEKQFMSHYANAMAEFKVKWEIDDSEMLDKMISELKEEVQKRIQCSINRELQKIQGRAGRTPRPPVGALSRDSTVQTEQRRRRLKVMRNKSINTTVSKSEDVNTASGTEFSDQRSEDEYCPCNTCMKKKMESRAVHRAEAVSLAPVVKEFDLRSILKTKKNAPAAVAKVSKQEEPNFKEAINGDAQSDLDVVQGESEVHNDAKGQIYEDKVEVEGSADAPQSKEENLEEDTTLASQNQEVDDGQDKDSGEEEKEGISDEYEAEEEKSEGQTTQDEERVEEVETETDSRKEGSVQEEKHTDIKEEEVKDGNVDKGVEDEDTAKEGGPAEFSAVEMRETGNSEHGDEADEEARTAEKQEAEEIEEKIETPEDGKGEEINVSQDELEVPENVAEAENEVAEMSEGGVKDEVNTTNMDQGEAPNEDEEVENQGVSSQLETEAKYEAGENQTKTEQDLEHGIEHDVEAKSTDEAEGPDQDNENEDSNKNETSDGGLNEKLSSVDTEADSSGKSHGEHSEHRLIKQMTKTSVESQPGSMESATDQAEQAKLKDICSCMEGIQDNKVVITTQSPFTKRRNLSRRHGNKDEVENEVIEWQVSPKRRNRSPARVNKQRRPRDSDVKVDDLEF